MNIPPDLVAKMVANGGKITEHAVRVPCPEPVETRMSWSEKQFQPPSSRSCFGPLVGTGITLGCRFARSQASQTGFWCEGKGI